MEIGRRIYYEKGTGNVILDTGERQGSVVKTTIEQDIEVFVVLSERNRETFDILELPYGAYSQDFSECNGYQVNVETKQLEFSYPNSNNPDEPQVFVKPLTEQIETLEQDNLLLKAQIQVNSDRTDFHEDLIAEIAMMLYQ